MEHFNDTSKDLKPMYVVLRQEGVDIYTSWIRINDTPGSPPTIVRSPPEAESTK
jgi:hypothetical protein